MQKDQQKAAALEENDSVQPALKFGQIISLESEEHVNCFIMSDGFTKYKAKLRDLSFPGAGSVYDHCLFQLYPEFSTQFIDMLLTTDYITRLRKKPTKKNIEKRKEFENKVITEYKLNLEYFEKVKGQPVFFGTHIQLLHVGSSKFLACNYIEADQEKENFRLELADFSSWNTCFTILPSRMHQKLSDGIVRASDVVYISLSQMYLSKMPYIHSSQDGRLKEEKNIYSNNQELHTLCRQSITSPIQHERLIQMQRRTMINASTSKQIQDGIAGDPKSADQICGDPNQSQMNIEEEGGIMGLREPLKYKTKLQVEKRSPNKRLSYKQLIEREEDLVYETGAQAPSRYRQIIARTIATMDNATKTMRREVNVSLESKNKWRLQLYSDYINDEDSVVFGDIIWLFHLEQERTLVTGKNPLGETIVKMEGSTMRELYQKYEGNTNGMWIIENTDFRVGGRVEWDQPFYLRHFTLGKYLSIDVNLHGKQDQIYLNLQNCPNSRSLFQLTRIVGGTTTGNPQLSQKYVTKDQFFYVKNTMCNAWVQISGKLHSEEQTEEMAIEHQNLQISLSRTPLDEDVFKLYRGTMTEAMETRFLISCFPLMNKMLKIFQRLKSVNQKRKEKLIEEMENLHIEKKLNQLKICLGNLIKFCQNKYIYTTLDHQRNYGKINKVRQKVLKEQYYLDILISLLQNFTDLDELKEIALMQKQEELERQQRESTQANVEQQQNPMTKPQGQGTSTGKFSVVALKGIKKIKTMLLNRHHLRIEQLSYYTSSGGVVTLNRQATLGKGTGQKEKMSIRELIGQMKQRPRKRLFQFYKDKMLILGMVYELITFICLENPENQQDVYKKMQSFWYQSIYISRCIDCIISIVGGNESIITNICDDIRLFEKNSGSQGRQTISISQIISGGGGGAKDSDASPEHLQPPIQKKPKGQSTTPRHHHKKRSNQPSRQPSVIDEDDEEQKSSMQQSSDSSMNTEQELLNQQQLQIRRMKQQGSAAARVSSAQQLHAATLDSLMNLDNVLMYFIKTTMELGPENRNENFLVFFSKVCQFSGKGISVNQETLYKFLNLLPQFFNSLLQPITVVKNNTMLKIDFTDGQIAYLESLKLPPDAEITDKYLNYLICQLRLYADLALTRNYLWKSWLDKIFPVLYVVEKVFDETLHKRFRSVFCNLLITQYVDHEPLNELIVPNMCRIFQSKRTRDFEKPQILRELQQNPERENMMMQTSIFQGLMNKSMSYVRTQIFTVHRSYEENLNKQHNDSNSKKGKTADNYHSELPGPDVLNDKLSFDIIRLLVMLVTYGTVNLLNQKQLYRDLASVLLRLFEYDQRYPKISYLLNKIRQERMQKQLQELNKNKVFSGFKNIISAVADNILDVGLGMRDMVGFMAISLGVIQKKKGELQEELAGYSENFFSKNPLIGGLITIQNMITQEPDEIEAAIEYQEASKKKQNQEQPAGDSARLEEVTKPQVPQQQQDVAKAAKKQKTKSNIHLSFEAKTEVQIKMQICNFFMFLYNLRMDYLISNFLAWFDHKGIKFGPHMLLSQDGWRKKFIADIEEDLPSALPDMYRTGINEVDDKYQALESNNLLGNLPKINIDLGSMGLDFISDLTGLGQNKIKIRTKPKKFQNYQEEHEQFLDLDILIAAQDLSGATTGAPDLQLQQQQIQSNQQQSPQLQQQQHQQSNKQQQQTGSTATTQQQQQQRKIKSELLPSLLTTFYMVNNAELEDRILDVVMKCFMQTSELFHHLNHIEVLIDQKDIVHYLVFKKRIEHLRLLAERSEVWLSEFMIKYNPEVEDLKQTIQILQDLEQLFYRGSIVDDKGNVVLGQGMEQSSPVQMQASQQLMYNQQRGSQIIVGGGGFSFIEQMFQQSISGMRGELDKTRQKIFSNLGGQHPLINLVKDAQNQMAQLLKGEEVPLSSKKIIFQLLQTIYQCLTLYCMDIKENQMFLSQFVTFFIDEIMFDYGQFDLIVSIYSGNTFLCQSFQDSMLKTVYKSISDIGHQSRFIKILYVIQQKAEQQQQTNRHQSNSSGSGHQQYMIENQMRIFNWLVPPPFIEKQELQRFQTVLYGNIDIKGKTQIKFDLRLPPPSQGDQPFLYHITLLDVLMMTIRGDEGFNINVAKLKSFIPLSYLLSLLKEPDSLMIVEEMAGDSNQGGRPAVRGKEKIIYDNSQRFTLRSIKDGFSLFKPKIIEFILIVYFNQEKPFLESLLKECSNFTSFFRFETDRLKLLLQAHISEQEEEKLLQQSPSKLQDQQKQLEFKYITHVRPTNAYMAYIFDYLIILYYHYIKTVIHKDQNFEYKDRNDYRELRELFTVFVDLIEPTFHNKLAPLQFQNLVLLLRELDEQFYKASIDKVNQCLEIGTISPQTILQQNGLLIVDPEQQQQKKNQLMIIQPQQQQQQPQQSPLLHRLITKVAGSKNPQQLNSQSNLNQKQQQQVVGQPDITAIAPAIQNISSPIGKHMGLLAGKGPGMAYAGSGYTSNLQRQQESQMPWVCSHNWRLFLKICQNSRALKEARENQIAALGDALQNIDKMISESLQKEHNFRIDYKDVLSKLIQFVQSGIVNKVRKSNIVSILQILESIIDNQLTPQQQEEQQNIMNQCDATKMFLNLISDSKIHQFDDEILTHLLSFMIKMMQNGNSKVQKTIYEFCTTHPRSEVLFERFHQFFAEEIDYLNQKRKLEQKLLNRKMLEDRLNDDAYNGTNPASDGTFLQNQISEGGATITGAGASSDQQQYTLFHDNIIVKQILHILQLFCIGHNNDMQNYLRYQKSSRNNYNMVSTVVELLYAYHQDISSENYDQIILCLGTLTEMVQGPCTINQETILDSKFFEIAQEFLNLKIPKPGSAGGAGGTGNQGATSFLGVGGSSGGGGGSKTQIKQQASGQSSNKIQSTQNLKVPAASSAQKPQEKLVAGEEGPTDAMIERVSIVGGGGTTTSTNNMVKQGRKQTTAANTKLNAGIGQGGGRQPMIARWQLEMLKYKTMTLVMSLMELNSSSMVIRRIMRSLPLSILKKNLATIYSRYKKQYADTYPMECLRHDQECPNDLKRTKHSASYYEVIIESGFQIFFLICAYLDLDAKEIDRETSSELNEIKQDFTKKEGLNLFNMKNNIIGQLGSLAFALIGGILGTVHSLTKDLQNKILGQALVEDPEKRAEIKRRKQLFIFKEAIKFFSQNSAHIEVVVANASHSASSTLSSNQKAQKQIEKVRFILMPYCKFMPKETKTEFQDDVNRDSTHTKLAFLLENNTRMHEICKHEMNLALFFARNKFISIFANYVDLWKDMAFLLTNLINILVVVSYSQGDSNNHPNNLIHDRFWSPHLGNNMDISVEQTMQVFFICGIIMIVCSTFVVLFFLLKKGPLYLREAWRENKEFIEKKAGCLFQLIKYGIVMLKCILRVLMNVQVIYYLGYGVLAFIATLVKLPFFFCFHLTEFLIRYPTLRNILRSAWVPKTQLALTLMLVFLIAYFFAIVAYVFFGDLYDGRCENMYYCFFETFDRTFKANGGVGGWIIDNVDQDPKNYDFGRFAFDNTNNILLVMIAMQILAGIIIDTFGEMRDSEHEKLTDIREICFICGFSREYIEKNSDQEFSQHIRGDHYLWNYLYYLFYIEQKEKTECTGIESYILQKSKQMDCSFFPIQKALALKQNQQSSIEELESELQRLHKNISAVANQTTNLLHTIEKENKQKFNQNNLDMDNLTDDQQKKSTNFSKQNSVDNAQLQLH